MRGRQHKGKAACPDEENNNDEAGFSCQEIFCRESPLTAISEHLSDSICFMRQYV